MRARTGSSRLPNLFGSEVFPTCARLGTLVPEACLRAVQTAVRLPPLSHSQMSDCRPQEVRFRPAQFSGLRRTQAIGVWVNKHRCKPLHSDSSVMSEQFLNPGRQEGARLPRDSQWQTSGKPSQSACRMPAQCLDVALAHRGAPSGLQKHCPGSALHFASSPRASQSSAALSSAAKSARTPCASWGAHANSVRIVRSRIPCSASKGFRQRRGRKAPAESVG
mmetsp:Transcript_100035/g.311692  ORF Transcript_100035/g.311692 Transcript_100035/m.311692 type:complete len:221 (+) Transcript_100035:466-1128(+)